MQHKRPEHEANLRYRRNRTGGSSSAVRFAVLLTVAIAIVVATFIFTTSYEFNAPPDDATSVEPATVDSEELRALDRKAASSAGTDSATGSSNDATGNSGDSSSTAADNTDPLAGANTIPASETIVAGCTVHGRVTDDWGSSMVGVRVFATTAEGVIVEAITDSRGRYRLPAPTPNAASMSITLAHVGESGNTFAVMVGDDPISLSTAIDPESAGCEVNFDSWNVQDQMIASPISSDLWPDAASIYQYTLNAEALALSLGADLQNGSTLQIQAWCEDPVLGCDTTSDGAYFIAENELEENSPPIIAMLPGRSSQSSPGIPDNREYHEYGHYFLSLQTGDNFALPAGDTNHGGYYSNSSSRDSFVEGFAEFYSMMVSRHVDDDDNAEIYTIGADYDLETDRLPWEAAGWWEEFTVAGLLLDLVDDDSDYTIDASKFTGVNVLDVETDSGATGTIISGSIVNTTPLVVRDADVTVRYLNEAGEVVGTQITRVLPSVIAPTRQGTFYAAPPAGIKVSQATATLGGIAKSDDDDISIELLRLMGILTEFERADGGQGVSNVAELYEAIVGDGDSQNSTGAELAEISTSQVDSIFVNHGFYADLDGDRKYNPEVDGEIGASSHPVRKIGNETYSAFTTRRDPDAYPGSFVTINTGDAEVDAIIQISMPSENGAKSYAYVAPKGGSDQVELAVPPANQNAEVTIITAGKNYKPVIAFRVEADNFHEKIENGTISELQVVPVELNTGTSLQQPAPNGSTIQLGVMIGGIIAVFLIVATLVAIRRQWGNA